MAIKTKKIIFVTGGVCSGIGKGVAISSIAALLKARGLKVLVRKYDPYLNIDPGTMNPNQHGEVFVTYDGVETDLDIGHYERLTDQKSSTHDYITSGKIYWDILTRERQGYYNGATVMVVPHVVDHIQSSLLANTDDIDILLCEIGGTIGDMEGMPVYEAMRQISNKEEYNSLFIHVAYLPFVQATMEFKTKPVQHSIRSLFGLGITPKMLICRTEVDHDSITHCKQKLANMTNINLNNVFLSTHQANLYDMLLMYRSNGIDDAICKHFHIDNTIDLKQIELCEKLSNTLKTSDKTMNIALVGKYMQLEDSYKSVGQSLLYASVLHDRKLNISWIDSELLEKNDQHTWDTFKAADGVIIPGGFGSRGIDGMLKAIEYARVNDKPLLGICLGMQLMATECARNLCGLTSSGSAEFADYEHKIIDMISHLMPEVLENKNTSKITEFIRLGEYRSQIKPGSELEKIYGANNMHERFRHRYELNKKYCDMLQNQNLEIVAACDIHENTVDFQNIANAKNTFIDSMRYSNKKFFIGVQCHPEFLSRPTTGHPLFNAFIKACLEV